jgi:murein L,D-transpeptidase YafK
MRFLLALALGLASIHSFASTPVADKIMVDKSERRLDVIAGGKVVATYRIGLGRAPTGHKQREGDLKTPEGSYVLDFKKADSAYFRAIHISYPNADDRARAKRAGVSPGGAIMIHGQPNDARVRAAVAAWPSSDWTDGCIALSNEDMTALWRMVRVPTPIEISP